MEEKEKKSGLSTASMVLGIIAICMCFIPFLNYISIILGVLSIIFGLIGIIKNVERGKAIAGFVLGIISVVIVYNMYFAFGKALKEVSNTIDETTGVSTSNSINGNETKTIGIGETITGKDVEVKIESANFSQKVEPP